MGIRHLARQRALQLLYALEFTRPADQFADVERLFLMADSKRRRGWGPFASQLSEEVFKQRQALDQAITPFLRKWTLDRLPRLDRICLRMALCELRSFPDIPLRVTINEYVELARLFSTDESPQYINAVLDQMAKDFPQKDFQLSEGEEPQPKSASPTPDAPEPEQPAKSAPLRRSSPRPSFLQDEPRDKPH